MTTALVLLDFQHGILHSPQLGWDTPDAPARAIAAAQRLLAAARDAGLPVIHVAVARPHRRGEFDAIRTAAAAKSGRAPRDVLALAPDSPESALILGPQADEEIVHKVGVSAFQGTRLDALLRSAGAVDVCVAGAFTHMVVESTVRQGFDLGYRMTVVQDACCAPSAAAHANALATGIPNFARLCGADDAVAAFAKAAGARSAPRTTP